MRVILFGFKGCGKTYYGKLLALHMHLPFIDTDFLIEEAAGRSPKEFALLYGEEAFRSVEKELIHALKNISFAVISLGGGAVLDPDNVKELQTLGFLVYLKKDKENVKKQLLTQQVPSYLDPDNPEDSFERMYAERKPLYEAIPAFQIETTDQPDSAVIQAIAKQMGFHG